MGLVPTTVNGPGLGLCALDALVIRCPSWTRWRSYSRRSERVARCAERHHLLQHEEKRQVDAARPSLGCTSTIGGDPAQPSCTRPRRAASLSDGTTRGDRSWSPLWPRCAAFARLKTRHKLREKTQPVLQLSIAVGIPVTRYPPGSRAGLLPPSPLRTTRASFPACRSSLANAPLRTRFHDGQSLAMDLGMTVRMEQHAVFGTVGTAMRAPHEMMGFFAYPPNYVVH